MTDVLVLCYHAVSPTWDADLSVTPDAFEQQLALLLRRGWRGATFRQAVERPPSRRTLAITFDDAFLSVLERAYPILSRLGLPATVFAPTSFTARRQPLSWQGIDHWAKTPHAGELECMSWEDLKRLADSGWEIGSHTRTHPRLTQLDDDELRQELEDSRRECAEAIGQPCDSLAYPYGDADERVARRAADAGYACAGALSSSLARLGPHRWPRVGIYHGDSYPRFWLKVFTPMRWVRASPVWPSHE
jgi:peptidoglycan/xylan/chitin deacetylase (PgdA/CDA1 family)